MSRFRKKSGNIRRNDVERALHTDTAPTDVPIVFCNDGFYFNLRRNARSKFLSELITRLVRENNANYTVPYRYRIRLTSTASRQLSLVHPAAQLRSCSFYKKYGQLIPYFCRHGSVSLRRPVKIGSTMFHSNARAGSKRYKRSAIDMLAEDKTVRNPGSYFAYAKYDRLYKFFVSKDFVQLEKRFSFVRQVDIAKCFSSIYSHTMAWAVKDVEHGKEYTRASSFANDFDRLMQYSSYNETNGVPVGSELSRIFAEIILQSADVGLLRRSKHSGLLHGIDFEVHRYVDDYRIFANDPDVLDAVERGLVDALGYFNLHLNELKTETSGRPFQTSKSQAIAKATDRLAAFRLRVSSYERARDVHLPESVLSVDRLVGELVADMKVACTSANVGYDEVSPYIVGAIAKTVDVLIESFDRASKLPAFKRSAYLNAFSALMSAIFFFFTVHVTVPASYSVAKVIIIVVRFFKFRLPEYSKEIQNVIRSLVMELVGNPALRSVTMSEYVPVEVMNIVLASKELPFDFRIDVSEIRDRILGDDRIDYFSYVSLLFYYEKSDPAFCDRVERKLTHGFLPKAAPKKDSHDAHFMLDLITCPHLSVAFRRRVMFGLLGELGIPAAQVSTPISLLAEMQQNPWFVNWREIDLLSYLRKKELSAVY